MLLDRTFDADEIPRVEVLAFTDFVSRSSGAL